MLLPRVIVVLLLKDSELYKGINFKDYKYIGDPINAVQIFNTKEVDEILFLDITATKENRITSPQFIQQVADQCLMPFSVGGGIKSVDDVKTIIAAGAEKVCLNTYALENENLITESAKIFGAQSIIVSIDIKKNWRGHYHVYSRCGSKLISKDLFATVKNIENAGAGEIVINNIDLDGTMQGFDLEILSKVVEIINIPVIACGGAGKEKHLKEAIEISHVSAAAAGSLFVFHGPRRAVLISYPDEKSLEYIRGS